VAGPALALAGIGGTLAGPGLAPRARAALAVAGAGAAAFGGYDDLAGDDAARGFRGHLAALARGEVTSGAVKFAGIGATGLASALLLGGGPADAAINAGLAAGGANLLNLFDLRPGRALKVALAGGALLAFGAPGSRAGSPGAGRAGMRAGAPGAGRAGMRAGRPAPRRAGMRAGRPAPRREGMRRGARAPGRAGPGRTPPMRAGPARAVAAPLGAAAALLPEDLGERAMLGDAGANALGAMLGAAAAASLSRPARLALLAAIAGLTAASEVVSFTTVIERTAALRWLDMLGRRPVPAAKVPGREDPPGKPREAAAAASP
jgi:hypothetical protein